MALYAGLLVLSIVIMTRTINYLSKAMLSYNCIAQESSHDYEGSLFRLRYLPHRLQSWKNMLSTERNQRRLLAA